MLTILRTKASLLLLLAGLTGISAVHASTYIILPLYSRVQWSDTIVLAQVTDPRRALLRVERVLKGKPASQIALLRDDDNPAVAAMWEAQPLIRNERELLFLQKKGNAYEALPIYGRLKIERDRISVGYPVEPWSLSRTIASIERLVALQTRIPLGDAEAGATYLEALRSDDVEVQTWALNEVRRTNTPSDALADEVSAYWPRTVGPGRVIPLVIDTVLAWRLERAAPYFTRILEGTGTGNERGWAAVALGATGNLEYLATLRRTAAEDKEPETRAMAYDGLVHMLGRDALDHLRAGATDAHEQVRLRAMLSAYNLLEIGHGRPRWPPPSSALIGEVRELVAGMRGDPSAPIRNQAISLMNRLR